MVNISISERLVPNEGAPARATRTRASRAVY
jgi:hypothetical protein